MTMIVEGIVESNQPAVSSVVTAQSSSSNISVSDILKVLVQQVTGLFYYFF